jgi:tetratricopeptide (TPR) repeat protein
VEVRVLFWAPSHENRRKTVFFRPQQVSNRALMAYNLLFNSHTHDGEHMSESNILEFTQSLIARGDLQAAENALRARLRLPPVPDGAFLLMTDILIREAKYTEAAQFFSEHPENADIFIRLRDYFIGERMNDAALSLISKSRFTDPGIAHINDSIVKQLGGDLSAGIAACNNALRFNTNDASAYNQLGRVLFNTGHPSQAQSAFEKAIALKSEFAEAWHNLGHVLRAQNKLDESEKAYARSVELAPYYRSGLLNLGVVKFARGKTAEALDNFRKLLELDPKHVDAHINAGIGEHILRNVEKAKFHYLQAIGLDPKNDSALRHLATLFSEELDTESAIIYFRRSLVLNPRLGDVWAELIELYERANRLDDAQTALTEASRILPNDANILYVLAKLSRRNNDIEKSIATFKKIDSRMLHPRFVQSFYFEFANTLDRAGEYDLSYQNFEKGNDLASRSIRAKQTDFNALDRHMDAIEEWLADGAFVERYEKEEDMGEDLCFLLGFSRSGTTLLDVMLDGHPKAQTLEERSTFEHVAFSIDKQFGGYPFGISSINASEREVLRKQYRAILLKEGITPNADGIIVDKMPIRTIHAACIHQLFPRAKFLFALRHPCDVILSNFMQNFAANEAFVHFNTLAESTRIYERVMRIWKTSNDLIPMPVHYVRYEKLVSDTERTLQEVCRFLDLPWVESMGAHQNTLKDRGRIKTSSYHQVFEPVYQRSLNRWQHYRPQLEPHLAKIKPYADYFSYLFD